MAILLNWASEEELVSSLCDFIQNYNPHTNSMHSDKMGEFYTFLASKYSQEKSSAAKDFIKKVRLACLCPKFPKMIEYESSVLTVLTLSVEELSDEESLAVQLQNFILKSGSSKFQALNMGNFYSSISNEETRLKFKNIIRSGKVKGLCEKFPKFFRYDDTRKEIILQNEQFAKSQSCDPIITVPSAGKAISRTHAKVGEVEGVMIDKKNNNSMAHLKQLDDENVSVTSCASVKSGYCYFFNCKRGCHGVYCSFRPLGGQGRTQESSNYWRFRPR